MKIDKMSLIRTILLVIALINQLLVAYGWDTLPVTSEQAELIISTLFTIITSVWAWWKNNYLSKRGQTQKKVLEQHDLYTP